MDPKELANKFAFPVSDIGPHGTYGMTLREYYAGEAMKGFCANHDFSEVSAAGIATMAVQHADALIAALAN